MKALILLAMAGVCLIAAEPAKETPKDPPKISDAQKKDAWKASSRYNAALAAKNKAIADLNAASGEEKDAKSALDGILNSLCPSGFVMQPDAAGDPSCAVKPADPTMKK